MMYILPTKMLCVSIQRGVGGSAGSFAFVRNFQEEETTLRSALEQYV